MTNYDLRALAELMDDPTLPDESTPACLLPLTQTPLEEHAPEACLYQGEEEQPWSLIDAVTWGIGLLIAALATGGLLARVIAWWRGG